MATLEFYAQRALEAGADPEAVRRRLLQLQAVEAVKAGADPRKVRERLTELGVGEIEPRFAYILGEPRMRAEPATSRVLEAAQAAKEDAMRRVLPGAERTEDVVRGLASAAVATGAGVIDTVGSAVRATGRALGLAAGMDEDTDLERLGKWLQDFAKSRVEGYTEPGLLTREAPQILGQLAAFGASSAAGPAVAMALGAAAQAGAQLTEAAQKGASREQQNIELATGTLLGLTEFLPLASAFWRLERTMPGTVIDKLKFAGLQGLEEAVQEGLTQIGQNISAADISQYDTDRSPLEGLKEAVAAGGSAGSILAGLSILLGARPKKGILREDVYRKLTELQEKLRKGELPGIEDREKLAQIVELMSNELRLDGPGLRKLRSYLQRYGDLVGTEALDKLALRNQGAAAAVAQTRFEQAQVRAQQRAQTPMPDAWPGAQGFKLLYNPPRPAPHPDGELIFNPQDKDYYYAAVERTLGIAAGRTPGDVPDAEAKIAGEYLGFADDRLNLFWFRNMRRLPSDPKEFTLLGAKGKRGAKIWTPDNLPKEGVLLDIKGAGSPKAVQELASYEPLLTTLHKLLLPGTRLIFTTSDRRGNAGVYAHLVDVDAHVIAVDKNLLERAADGDFLSKAEVLSTLVHEMGHAYAFRLTQMEGRSGTEKLLPLYARFMKDVEEGKIGSWVLAAYGDTITGRTYPGGPHNPMTSMRNAISNLRYLYSPAEWVAQTMALQVTQELLQHPGLRLPYKLPRKVVQQYVDTLEASGRFMYGELLPGQGAAEYVRMALDKEYAISALNKVYQEAKLLVKPRDVGRLYPIGPADLRKLGGWVQRLNKVAKAVFGSDKPPPSDELGGWSPDGSNWRYVPAHFTFMQKMFAPLLVHLERNIRLPGVAKYYRGVKLWATTRSEWMVRAQDRLRQWRELPLSPKQHAALEDALFEITLKSDQLGRALTRKELDVILQRKGIARDDVRAFLNDLFKDYQDAIDTFYQQLINDADAKFALDPDRREEVVKELNAERNRMINRHFFPLTRFGEYYLEVREGDKVVYFETFETKAERAARRRELQAQGKRPVAGKLTRAEREYMGMPREVLQRLAETLDLDAEQRSALMSVLHRMAPGQSFRRHLIKRKGVAGYSKAARRTYAAYFRSFANHIARMKGQAALGEALMELGDYVRKAEHTPDLEVDQERDLLNYLQEHMDYILHPRNEWEAARAAVSLYYLGMVPKSAFVNMTQLPLGTYPWLAARFGDGAALREMVRAMKDIRAVWKQRADRIGSDLAAALRRAEAESVLSETFAAELAAVAEGTPFGGLGISTRSERLALGIHRAAEIAMTPFRLAEELNRRVTFVAAWRLAERKGIPLAERYGFAVKAVEATQFAYSKWNKPLFMRGKRSVAFVFWSYWVNFMWFLRTQGGPTAARSLFMLAALGGLTALPFAEDFLDFMEGLGTRLRRMLGYKDPYVDLREDIRRYVQQAGLNPDLVMTGLLGSFGPFTIQPSISMGRVLPGAEVGARFLKGVPPETADLTRQIASASAGPAIIMSMLDAVTSDDPDVWKRVEKALPQAAKNVSAAVRRAVRGEETAPSGATLATFNVENPEDLAELVGKGLGFEATRVARERDFRWSVKEKFMYYMGWRYRLMKDFEYAYRRGSGVQKVLERVREYNAAVPHPALRIDARALMRSLKGRVQRQLMEEKFGAPQRSMVPIAREYEELYSSGR